MDQVVKTSRIDGAAPPSLFDFVPDFEALDGWLAPAVAERLFQEAAAVTSGCIVEVGSYRGRSTVALAAGSQNASGVPVFAVEPHEKFIGIKGGAFGPSDRRAFYRNMLATKLFATVRLLNTTSQVVTAGWDKQVSLLFIDGDHRYEAVCADFECWRPFLQDGAAVLFHAAKTPGPAQVIKEMAADGWLTLDGQVGQLAVTRFVARPNRLARHDLAHEDLEPVYPEVEADAEVRQDGLSLKTIGYNVYYGGGGGYLYQAVPKCGCTSIKTLLLELEGLPVDADEWRRHNKQENHFPGTDKLPPEEQLAVFQGRTNTFKFVFVRDPYTRMASVYEDKIRRGYRRRQLHWINKVQHAAQKFGIPISEMITFDEFVRVACQQNVETMDEHWRPQHYEGRFGIIKFDFVGRTETLTTDLIYVMERLNAPEKVLKKAARPQNVTGSSIGLWSEVPAETRQLFVKKYQIDFDELRYPFRYQYTW